MGRTLLAGLLLSTLLITSRASSGQQPATPSPNEPAAPSGTQPSQPGNQPTSQPTSQPGNQNNPAVQQSATGQYTIRTSTRLVVLDVVVTDKDGNVVKDLRRDEFHVTEQNEPETILNFEQTGAHALPQDLPTINSTAELDKAAPRAPVNIILLDEFNTRFEDEAFAQYSLKKFLERQPDRLTTPTMLLAVSLDHFTVLKDYTQDKQALMDALKHHLADNPWRATNASWAGEKYATAFASLMRVAEATEGHPGHKNMIWIGRGFPSLNLANYPVDSQNRVDNAVQNCVNMLRDARVTLYTIDPAGVQIDPGTYGADAAFVDPFGGNYQFDKLARATGGRTIHGRNDVDAQIAEAANEGTSFYTLTYRPTLDSSDPTKFRKIKVTVDRPGLTATTRVGYYLARRPAPVNPEAPSRRLAFDLVSAETTTMNYDGVPISVTPSAATPGTYLLRIEGRALAWSEANDTTPRKTEFVLLTATFDKKGKELKRSAKNMTVAAPTTVSPTGRIDFPIQVPVTIDADPKAVRARIVVRIGSSGRIGTYDIAMNGAAPGKTPESKPNQ